MKVFRILVVDDEVSARKALAALLEHEGYETAQAPDGIQALHLVETFKPDIVLTDLRMPLMDGLELIKELHVQDPDLCCIVMTAYGTIDNALEAIRSGANHYLTKPLNFDEVMLILEKCIEHIKLRREFIRMRDSRVSTSDLIFRSQKMESVVRLAEQVAKSQSTVLISGESGTGKEMLAKFLHRMSSRFSKPFVALNCAAIPENLIESEIFGHEKGAFTGAVSQRDGKFRKADKGTLFLDEIGELSTEMQVKLLRVLQERSFEPVGGDGSVDVDVRVLAASNKNLRDLVERGEFREDLFYRLNVIEIEIPPLRERVEDIAALVVFFIARHAERNQKKVHDISPGMLAVLESYQWPGNVRELENVVERAVVLTQTETIEVQHLPAHMSQSSSPSAGISIPGSSMEEIERYAILQTYRSEGGNTKSTAKVLGISQRKVQYKLKDLKAESTEMFAKSDKKLKLENRKI